MRKINQIESVFRKNIFIIIFLCVGIIILTQMTGYDFSKLPGDMGDTRFNQYVLEHFYQFITNRTTSFWNAPFFYPFKNTIAFSDSHLGSAPIYSFFRFIGFNQNTSLQIWIIIGYITNLLVANTILFKLGMKPLSAALGAFLFSFGLPVMAQENHIQLTYRFCVPLVSFFFWKFSNKPKLTSALFLIICLTMQFYFSIYIGFFLVLLVLIMIFMIPVFLSSPSQIRFFGFWKNILVNAWIFSSEKERKLFLLGLIVCFFSMGFLLIPHYSASQTYGFSRTPEEIKMMLPQPQSYFLADHSKFWNGNRFIFPSIPMQHEHQLFIGLSSSILILIGLMTKKSYKFNKFVLLNIICAFLLVIYTIRIRDFSIYQFFAFLPIFSSIRSVSRIILVLIWPISIFTTAAYDSFLRKKQKNIFHWLIIISIPVFLIFESLIYDNYTYSIKDSQSRLDKYIKQINETKENINEDSILYIGFEWDEKWYMSELDGMLLAQELGISTLNGYSGNFPYEYQPFQICEQISYRISSFMDFSNITDKNYYDEIINKVVPINVGDCEFSWIK